MEDDISEQQRLGVIMSVRIRITVHGKERDSSAHKYFILQTAEILIYII